MHERVGTDLADAEADYRRAAPDYKRDIHTDYRRDIETDADYKRTNTDYRRDVDADY